MSEHPSKPSREAQKIDELMRDGFPLKESREAVDLHKSQDGTYRMKEEVVEEKESRETDKPRFIATESGLVTDTLASEGRDLTPAEEHEALRKAVQGVLQIEDKKLRENAETVPAVINASERGNEAQRLEDYLEDRSTKLGAEAAKMGVPERWFRRIGEAYNKLGWKTKLGVGVALGLGAGAASAVSMPAALACTFGIGVQRIAGMSSMFLKAERDLQAAKEGTAKGFLSKRGWYKRLAENADKEGTQKKTAFIMAVVWTGAMIGAAVGLEHFGGAAFDWLKDHWPSGHGAHASVEPKAPSVATGGQSDSYETFKQTLLQRDLGNKDMDKFFDPSAHAPGAAVPGVTASAHVPIEVAPVHAVAGHGYEEMLYKLGQEIHDKYPHGLPQGTSHDSDAWTLWHAAAKGDLKGEVHQMAMGTNGGHGFFNADGTSVRVDPSAHVSIGADGQVHFGDPTHPDMIHAAPGMRTTLPYQPEAHIHHTGGKLSAASTSAPEAPPAAPTSPMETAPSTASGHAPLGNVTPPAGINTPPHAEIPQGAPDISHEGPTAVSPNHFPPAFTIHGDIATTANGLDVPLSQPHLYAGWNGDIFAYGGSPAERAHTILEYLKNHPKEVIYSASDDEKYRIPWHFANGEAVPGLPARAKGLFGFLRTFLKAPDPSSLQKLIK